MKRLVLSVLGLALVAGCAASRSGAYRAADFDRQAIATVAVLPVWYQTQAPPVAEPFRDALVRQLTVDKRYGVVPPTEVSRSLNQGGGASAFGEMLALLSHEEPVSDALYGRLAHALEVDALLSVRVLAYHQVPEQVPTTSLQGAIYYQTVDVTVVELAAELWATGAHQVVWRDRFLDRQYADGRSGRPAIGRVVDSAVKGLLASLPVNTWAPAPLPTPVPVPTPVTSLAPLPWPADPARPR